MKILHLADTHLGFSAYRKITENGMNQRELDVYNAFIQCINYAIDTKPDMVIHAGDLFDSVRPTNRAITVALQQVLRLSQSNIPFLVISGNHDCPKLKETGNILKIFEHIDNVFPIFNEKYEKVDLNLNDEKISLHAIPQCQTNKNFNENLKKVKTEKNSDFNALIVHGAVTTIKEFKMNEFNELIIPSRIFDDGFDYVALGHYHKYTKIKENVFYSGSTENFSFSDLGVKKGLIEIDFNKNISHKFIEIKNRTMVDISPINCEKLDIQEIESKIKKNILEIQPEEKVLRIKLLNIPSHIFRGINFNEIRKLTKKSVHFELKPDVQRDDIIGMQQDYKIQSIGYEFKKYLDKQVTNNKEELEKLGTQYIQKVESIDEGK